MKSILLSVLLITALAAAAQKPGRSIFRNGYQRFGLNLLGSQMDMSQSPAANILTGKFGAKKGYCIEFGRVFYFNKKSESPFRYGLDWTYVSLTNNKLDWGAYSNSSAGSNVLIEGTSIAASVAARLGPVVSFNPFEKFVIDARVQLAPSFYLFDQSYFKNEGQPDEQYFEFADYTREEADGNYNAESVKNRISFGTKTSFGITIRRKAIGLAFDYVSGKIKMNYSSDEGSGQRKVNAGNLQLKLSFQL